MLVKNISEVGPILSAATRNAGDEVLVSVKSLTSGGKVAVLAVERVTVQADVDGKVAVGDAFTVNVKTGAISNYQKKAITASSSDTRGRPSAVMNADWT